MFFVDKLKSLKASVSDFFSGWPHNLRRTHSHQPVPSRDPYFEAQPDPETGFPTRNFTTVEGGKATLICTVRNLGENNTVSLLDKSSLLVAALLPRKGCND